MEKEKINNRLNGDMKYLQELGYVVLGVFLQGSQNYELDYEGSDIDTKAIIIPTFDDFVSNKKPISTTIVLENNEHIDVKDIREMHKCFLKQNINFLEILFTEYKILNPFFAKEYQIMFDMAEDIAHFNKFQAVKCMYGMAIEKQKALCHPYPTTKEKIEKYGYDNKQLHHIIRMNDFMQRYICGVSFKECLIPTNKEFLISVKSTYNIDVNNAIKMADLICNNMKKAKEEYESDLLKGLIDKEIPMLIDEVTKEILKKQFKYELFYKE